MQEGQKKTFFITAAALIVVASFTLGAFFGYGQRPAVERVLTLFGKETGRPEGVDFAPFWVAWNIIEEKYAAGPEGIDRQKMVWGAIQGALESLGDPYTVFFPPREKELFESEIQGNFEGVGMEIGVRDGILTVIAPLKDTPAYRAGIRAGDKILQIEEKSTASMTVEEAVQLIRGEKGTAVNLTILSENNSEPRKVSITRDVIKIPVLETEKLEDGIFIIRLYNFSAGSTFEFRSALREMLLSGSDKLIIDLRNNPGGFLEAAVDISSWFLDTGKIVVREKFQSGEETLYRSRGYRAFENLPVAILINEGSASASEIVAGALQDHGIAKLVGDNTFGKGSVQELVNVTGNTAIKVTIARWLTPNGNDISEGGLTPDFEVKDTKDAESDHDPQLQKAIEVLKNWP